MIDVYKERLAKNDWLTPETRDKAIVKRQCHQALYRLPRRIASTLQRQGSG